MSHGKGESTISIMGKYSPVKNERFASFHGAKCCTSGHGAAVHTPTVNQMRETSIVRDPGLTETENGFMEPKYDLRFGEVIGHPNHHLRI